MFSNEFSPIECGKIRSDLLLITFPVSQSSASLVHAFDNSETLTIVTIVRILLWVMGSDMGQRLEIWMTIVIRVKILSDHLKLLQRMGASASMTVGDSVGTVFTHITSPYFGLAIIVTPQYNSDIKPFRTLTLVWWRLSWRSFPLDQHSDSLRWNPTDLSTKGTFTVFSSFPDFHY